MTNLGQMMKQAQEMQNKMAEIQEKLSELEVTGSAGGGMVDVTLTGKNEARRVKIDPDLAGAENLEILEDLIVAAVNDAIAAPSECPISTQFGQPSSFMTSNTVGM